MPAPATTRTALLGNLVALLVLIVMIDAILVALGWSPVIRCIITPWIASVPPLVGLFAILIGTLLATVTSAGGAAGIAWIVGGLAAFAAPSLLLPLLGGSCG